MGMAIGGLAEYRDTDGWAYIDDLPFIVRASLYYELFGQTDAVEGVTPVAPDRGIPDDLSEQGRERYDRQTLDRGYHVSWGESWLTLDEFPSEARERHEETETDWGAVFEMLAPYEAEYGAENVRVVVWFTG